MAKDYLTETPHHTGLKFFRKILGLLVLSSLVLAGYIMFELGLNPLDPGTLNSDAGRTNVLVLGVGDQGHAGSELSDANLVISLNSSTNSIAVISVPRDLRVSIPGYYPAKINLANALGGARLAEQTMSDTLGLPMHYYLRIDFSALKQSVDAVGGIDVEVKERLFDPEYPCEDNQYQSCGLDIRPGKYHMDGKTALSYARCRKGTCGNDFGRNKRQQEVLGLLKTRLLSPAVTLNPWRLKALVKVWREHVSTNMSPNKVLRLVWLMAHSDHTINLVLDNSPEGFLRGLSGSSDLVPKSGNFSELREKVNSIFEVDSAK